MDNDDMKLMASAVVAGLIISIGVGMLVGIGTLAEKEGASWEWWQVIGASILGLSGALTGIPVAVYVAGRIWLYVEGF